MRALLTGTLLVLGCGGASPPPPGMPLEFNGDWSGTLMHPATTCTDNSIKAAYSAATSFQINQDQAGLFLIWSDRCPVAGNIVFAVDATGTATQKGDPALCLSTPIAQATFFGGVMTVSAGTLTLTITETEHDSGAQTRDCEWPITATMTRP